MGNPRGFASARPAGLSSMPVNPAAAVFRNSVRLTRLTLSCFLSCGACLSDTHSITPAVSEPELLVHYVQKFPAAHVAPQVLAKQLDQPHLPVRSPAGGMHRHHYVRAVENGVIRWRRLLRKHIQAGACDPILAERLYQGEIVEERSA